MLKDDWNIYYRWDIWAVSEVVAWWQGALGPVNLTAIGASGSGGPPWRRSAVTAGRRGGGFYISSPCQTNYGFYCIL